MSTIFCCSVMSCLNNETAFYWSPGCSKPASIYISVKCFPTEFPWHLTRLFYLPKQKFTWRITSESCIDNEFTNQLFPPRSVSFPFDSSWLSVFFLPATKIYCTKLPSAFCWDIPIREERKFQWSHVDDPKTWLYILI